MAIVKKVVDELKKRSSISDKENLKKKTEYYNRLQEIGIIKKEEYKIAPIDTVGKTYNI